MSAVRRYVSGEEKRAENENSTGMEVEKLLFYVGFNVVAHGASL
jgi:hypothetical protein